MTTSTATAATVSVRTFKETFPDSLATSYKPQLGTQHSADNETEESEEVPLLENVEDLQGLADPTKNTTCYEPPAKKNPFIALKMTKLQQE